MTGPTATVLPGGHSEWEPPDPFSNSEVKTLCADASVDFVDVKVGHCQALESRTNPRRRKLPGVFSLGSTYDSSHGPAGGGYRLLQTRAAARRQGPLRATSRVPCRRPRGAQS